MTRLALILAVLMAFAACGVDGPPERPTASPAEEDEGENEANLRTELKVAASSFLLSA